jgi:hypothetical protein
MMRSDMLHLRTKVLFGCQLHQRDDAVGEEPVAGKPLGQWTPNIPVGVSIRSCAGLSEWELQNIYYS